MVRAPEGDTRHESKDSEPAPWKNQRQPHEGDKGDLSQLVMLSRASSSRLYLHSHPKRQGPHLTPSLNNPPPPPPHLTAFLRSSLEKQQPTDSQTFPLGQVILSSQSCVFISSTSPPHPTPTHHRALWAAWKPRNLLLP